VIRRRIKLSLRPKPSSIWLMLAGCALVCTITACGYTSSPSQNAAAATLLKNITPLERKLLADKYVTFSKYETAIAATVSCMRSHGFSVPNPVRGADGLLNVDPSYDFGDADSSSGPSQQEQQRVDSLEGQCVQESAAVEAVYMLDHAASARQTAADFSSMAACLRNAGVDMPARPKLSQISKLLRATQSAVGAGRLTSAKASACERDFAPADFQPLPGLAQALAAMKNP
jgi:hypothetical protein